MAATTSTRIAETDMNRSLLRLGVSCRGDRRLIERFRRALTMLCIVLASGSMASAVTLSGRVYEGQTGVEPPPSGNAKALAGVTVNLYGANDAGQMGTYITSTTTASDGWYGLSFSTLDAAYDFYNIVAMAPPGYVSQGATSVSGTVKSSDWIQYEFIELGQTTTGNKFWYQPITITKNQAPVVFAGSDSVETIAASLPHPRPLAGVVSDDGLPEGEPLVIEWTLVDGPHEVVFEDASDPRTIAHFHGYGSYVLRLSAFDGELEAFDEVTIEIRESAPDWGGILFEWWFDIGDGTRVDDLTGHPRFSDQPDRSELRTSFKGPTDWRDEYGTRVRGYLYPPATGDYTFWIGSDDSSELWLSLDDDPANSVEIASVEIWNNSHAWDKYQEQPSEPQRLVAGLPYYIEALHKEGGGGDQLAVAWAGPQIGLVPEIIDGSYLRPCLPELSIRPGLPDNPAGGEGYMGIREVSDNGEINDQGACYASLSSGGGTIVDYTAPVLNIQDSGGNGHYGDDDVFGVVTTGGAVGTTDYISLMARGTIRIPAGQGSFRTFGINSDDGFTLQFPGHDFISAIGGELVDLEASVALRFSGGRVAGDTLGIIWLPAGDHAFWLTYHEEQGDAAVEFFAAKGNYETFDPQAFHLVGAPGIGSVAVPGFCEEVTMEATEPGVWSGGAIDSLADALAALAQGQSNGTNSVASYPSVNHIDPDVGGPALGSFPGDVAFPNHTPGRDDDDFAVKVTGLLDIPADGTYQIGFNSDDGASLRISGRTWNSIVADATGNAAIAGDELINDSLTGRSLTAGEIALPAGCHPFEAVMFERTGGAFFELIGRGVSDKGIPDRVWRLLTLGGAGLTQDPGGLQLVPPVPE